MAVYSYQPGPFLPSQLAAELSAAHVPVLGVTGTTNSAGVYTEVQVIVDDSVDKATVDPVVAAHSSTPTVTPAMIADQRSQAEHVQVANINETDWIITPPPDTDQGTLNQINNNLAGWQTFRQALRALPVLTIPDPTQLVWPAHPIRPATALTPKPGFVK